MSGTHSRAETENKVLNNYRGAGAWGVRPAMGLIQTVLLSETLKVLPNICFGLISSVLVVKFTTNYF